MHELKNIFFDHQNHMLFCTLFCILKPGTFSAKKLRIRLEFKIEHYTDACYYVCYVELTEMYYTSNLRKFIMAILMSKVVVTLFKRR